MRRVLPSSCSLTGALLSNGRVGVAWTAVVAGCVQPVPQWISKRYSTTGPGGNETNNNHNNNNSAEKTEKEKEEKLDQGNIPNTTTTSTSTSNNNTDNSSGSASGDVGSKNDSSETSIPEDADAIFRRMRMRRDQNATGGAESPVAQNRQSARKTMFFESAEATEKEKVPESNTETQTTTTATTDATSNSAQQPQQRVAVGGRKIFLDKLTKMNDDSTKESSPTYRPAKESRKKKIEQKILSERKQMLVFRDVGMDLDKPILSRDVFLVFKYMRYGLEFAIDNELERLLRYFNEHAINELKVIQDSKLMRGPPTLSRKRTTAPAGAVLSGNHVSGGSLAFPQVRAANLRQYCAFKAEDERDSGSSGIDAKRRLQRQMCAVSANAPPAPKPGSRKGPSFQNKNEAQFTLLNPGTFRRPAVVIYSQLGQKLGAEADLEWRHLAFSTIQPAVVETLPPISLLTTDQIASAKQAQSLLKKADKRPSSASGAHKSTAATTKPIDVISLRSMDIYKYAWVHRLYVRRFAKNIVHEAYAKPPANKESSLTEEQQMLNQLDHAKNLAGSTYVGFKLLEPFYKPFSLRNYLSPHIMLVDHEGIVRWMSAGCPDQYEREYFPALLQQLEMDYYKAKGGSSR